MMAPVGHVLEPDNAGEEAVFAEQPVPPHR